MATIKIKNHTLLTYESEIHQQNYWKSMSKFIFDKYGKKEFEEFEEVNLILKDCFDYLLNEFKNIIEPINNHSFYKYCYFLHEESLEILLKSRDDLKIENYIEEAEFSRYRRILKLILEQGCVNILQNNKVDNESFLFFDEIIQKLIYLGTWLYMLADHIAYHRMLNGCKKINFEDEDLLIEWKNNFGKLYTHLFEKAYKDYEKALYEENSITELIEVLNKNYEMNYDFALGMIFEIQKKHSNSRFQTIQPYVLPLNLSNNFPINHENATDFYEGLSISNENKMSIEECILKPYSTQRYLFRPLLIYNIEGDRRMYVSKNKLAESIYVLASNAINWNTLPPEWLKNHLMKQFISRKGNLHDKVLEDNIQTILLENKLKFCRNIKSIKTDGNNINIDNQECGEIDFIILDDKKNRLLIADSKYNKARYEGVGYRADYSNFSKYEKQIQKKIDWILKNILHVQTHFRKVYKNNTINIENFEVKGLFLINTPTFYMYNSKYDVITLSKVKDYLNDVNVNPIIKIEYDGVEYEYKYPYFTV